MHIEFGRFAFLLLRTFGCHPFDSYCKQASSDEEVRKKHLPRSRRPVVVSTGTRSCSFWQKRYTTDRTRLRVQLGVFQRKIKMGPQRVKLKVDFDDTQSTKKKMNCKERKMASIRGGHEPVRAVATQFFVHVANIIHYLAY